MRGSRGNAEDAGPASRLAQDAMIPRSLAIDVGSSSVRTGLVDARGRVTHVSQRALDVTRARPGEVELDAEQIAHHVLELAHDTLSAGGAADAIGITNQRATTVVFDASTGRPVGPALSWQDLRTVLDCLTLQATGLRLAPNQSATKAAHLIRESGVPPERARVATLDTWITWRLTGGRSFVTDFSNAAVTGLVGPPDYTWDATVLEQLGLRREQLATIVSSVDHHGTVDALGGLPITALLGDQPASLLGQCLVDRGAKITFGTGAMLDLVGGVTAPTAMVRYPSGCFPVVVRSQDGQLTWGVEGIVLSAGAALDGLRDGLGLFAHVSEVEALAGSVATSQGVWFVPASVGLGTPFWDFGARSGFFGLTQGTTRAHLVRAVLEGIAHRGADLVEAAEVETGEAISEVRVDGGMSANAVFLQALADALGRPVEVGKEREATTRGIGLLALVGAGAVRLAEIGQLWHPDRRIEPRMDEATRVEQRATWRWALDQVRRTIPELSEIDF